MNDVETSSVELAIPKRESSLEESVENEDHGDDEEEDNGFDEEFVREELIRKIENTKKKIEREQQKAVEQSEMRR